MKGRGARGAGAGGARAARKDAQVCAAVAEVVSLTLGAETEDPELAGLWVREVVPWPDASRLLVIFEASEGADAAALEKRIAEHDGTIRAEVAQELQRKRTPLLSYRVLPAGSAKLEE